MPPARATLLACCPALLLAQAAFDVASVKPTLHGRKADGSSHSSIDMPSPGRFVTANSSLAELIRFAYEIKDYQLSGPVWLNDDSECFDIAATAPTTTTPRDMSKMVQTLLAERFHLAVHRETKVLPVYRLVAGKRAPNLRQSATDGDRSSTSSSGGRMTFTDVSMSDFAYQLSRELNRPVLDATELKGSFDFTLRYDAHDSGNGPSLFTALQEQLGLRLESAKAPIDVIVVDHIDKLPTAN